MPPSPQALAKVKEARSYAMDVLCDRARHARKPAFCPVCDGCGDSGSGAASDCYFYRYEGKRLSEGTLPLPLYNIRKQVMRQSYLVIAERAVTHKHKYTIQWAIDQWGEEEALHELELAGIIGTGYRITEVRSDSLVLRNNTGARLLMNRKPVRLVGKEDGIPLFASVNAMGSVREAHQGEVIVEFFRKTSVQRASRDLAGREIVVLPSEINLTRRMLQPLHLFHRWAGDVLLPVGEDSSGT